MTHTFECWGGKAWNAMEDSNDGGTSERKWIRQRVQCLTIFVQTVSRQYPNSNLRCNALIIHKTILIINTLCHVEFCKYPTISLHPCACVTFTTFIARPFGISYDIGDVFTMSPVCTITLCSFHCISGRNFSILNFRFDCVLNVHYNIGIIIKFCFLDIM